MGPQLAVHEVAVGESAVIGRLPFSDICLMHEGVSRRHALVAPKGEGWVLSDQGRLRDAHSSLEASSKTFGNLAVATPAHAVRFFPQASWRKRQGPGFGNTFEVRKWGGLKLLQPQYHLL